MKKLYFLLLFFIPTSIFAQPYFNNGAKWLYGWSPWDTVSYIQIEKTGETWIGGKFCDELKFSLHYAPQAPNPIVNYNYTYFSGDTVYIYNSTPGTFGALYDFTASAGDTMYCSLCSGGMIIDSVNQVMFGSLSLEAQHYTVGLYQLTTFEKIGNTGYFIPDFNTQSPSAPGWQLRCYEDSTGLSYYDGFSDCSLLASIETHQPISISASSFGATITCSAIKPGTEISVYDIGGNLVSAANAQQDGSCSVDFSTHAQAMYFVTIRNGDLILAQKFVVVKSN